MYYEVHQQLLLQNADNEAAIEVADASVCPEKEMFANIFEAAKVFGMLLLALC